jgi:CRP-like cAMP-binding protein
VGSELALDEGTVLVDPERPSAGLYLILQGVLLVVTPHAEDERGPGQVVGMWERLDGTDEITVTAKTEARVVAIDRAAYEAAVSG